MSASGNPAPLSFHWAERESGSWWLAIFVLLSLLLHSAAFFLFQGRSPLTAHSPRTAPAIRILTPYDRVGQILPENEALLRWIATQDPALVASIPATEPKGLLPVPYKPSFETVRTLPLGVPPEPPTIAFPPPQDPLALIRGAMPRSEPRPMTPAPEPTLVSVSASISTRSPADLRFAPKSKADKPVEPTTLLTAISGGGESRFTFLQQGSGDTALDAEAADFVRSLKFGPSQESLAWGTMTFFWGDDVQAAPEQGPPAPR
jgi:outer membrane biosynthesis protein TonB